MKTLTIYYDTEISLKEIPLFRGAVLQMIGEHADPLYHNHIGDSSFRYAYPLIQYKRIHRKAAIVCIDKGIDAVGQLLSKDVDTFRLGDHQKEIKMTHIKPFSVNIQIQQEPLHYHIHNWLPLNTKNYRIFHQIETIEGQQAFLENILKANILAMLKGLGIHLEETLMLCITQISVPHVLYFKGIGLTSFNADFTCNLPLPDHIGIGKNASIGFGVIHKVMESTNINEQQE